MKQEKVNGHPIACYDSGPNNGADRYTVVYLNCPELHGCFQCVGMSAAPFHPQGIGQHSAAKLGRHLGRRIKFSELPADCQQVVINDTKEGA